MRQSVPRRTSPRVHIITYRPPFFLLTPTAPYPAAAADRSHAHAATLRARTMPWRADRRLRSETEEAGGIRSEAEAEAGEIELAGTMRATVWTGGGLLRCVSQSPRRCRLDRPRRSSPPTPETRRSPRAVPGRGPRSVSSSSQLLSMQTSCLQSMQPNGVRDLREFTPEHTLVSLSPICFPNNRNKSEVVYR